MKEWIVLILTAFICIGSMPFVANFLFWALFSEPTPPPAGGLIVSTLPPGTVIPGPGWVVRYVDNHGNPLP